METSLALERTNLCFGFIFTSIWHPPTLPRRPGDPRELPQVRRADLSVSVMRQGLECAVTGANPRRPYDNGVTQRTLGGDLGKAAFTDAKHLKLLGSLGITVVFVSSVWVLKCVSYFLCGWFMVSEMEWEPVWCLGGFAGVCVTLTFAGTWFMHDVFWCCQIQKSELMPAVIIQSRFFLCLFYLLFDFHLGGVWLSSVLKLQLSKLFYAMGILKVWYCLTPDAGRQSSGIYLFENVN